MTALLRVDDAKVHFGGVKAVDGISLEVSPGEVHGVVGPNGSGKTTLINAISGVQPLTSGTIEFDGRDLTSAPAHVVSRAGVARTFQSIKLLPTLTVRENVLLGADWTSFRGRRGGEKAADAALDRVDLCHLAGSEPEGLPYGTRRRVEIARALVSEPKLILLDEPIAGMNQAERADIAAVIRRLGDEGIAQLVIEHDLRTLLAVSDHLFVMNFGRLVAEGPPRETAAGREVQEIYLGKAHAPA